MEPGKNQIADLSGYLYKMQKSMIDKMFFIDKIFEPIDTIVDFGCANGELIKMLQYYFDEYSYVGYDISEKMVQAAKENVPGAVFCSDWNSIGVPFERSLLNISSVIHEVYSYCAPDDIDLFWRRVFDSGFRYVTIRDMMLSQKHSDTPASESDLGNLRANRQYRKHLEDYESVWGRIKTEKQMAHYLLKYSYTQNWDREVREDYLGLTLEELNAVIPKNYRVTYCEHYTLPYVGWQIKKDFGIELKIPTHIKMIAEKTD